MSQRKIGKSWWVDITYDQVRYRKKSPDDTKEGTKAYEATLRRKLAEGKLVDEQSSQKEHSQLFHQFSEFWFETHVLVHNKPSMAAKTRGVLINRIVPHFGQTPLCKISTLQVEQYKAKAVSGGLSNKTVNCDLSVLSKCLRDAKRWIGLTQLPEIISLKVPPVGYDFLTMEECSRLLSELSGIWHDIVYVALKTGLRIGELQALNTKNVHFESKKLSVQYSLCSITKELISTKGNSIRVVPLPKDVVGILQRRPSGDLVFGCNDTPFQGQKLNKEIADACARAGLRKVTCHVLRHSYASHLAMKGVPVVVIQKLLGHTDIKVTMRYAHLSEDSINQAVEALQLPYSTETQTESRTNA